MAERGRKPGFVMSDEHRVKIQNSNILNRLIACAEGDVELTSTQATVALGLMKKVLPDLTSTTIGGTPDGEPVSVKTIITGVPRAGDSP
jgi:hypothetical protein